MLVLIAQKKRPGALNGTQKTIGLCQVLLLRKSRKTLKNTIFTKMPGFGTFWCFFLIFSVTLLSKDLWNFFCCIQCPKTLLLSYQNQIFEKLVYCGV